MITWITTHIVTLPIWEIWLAILFSIGCVFWILNQVGTWRDRHKKTITESSPKELITLVYEWIGISSWQVRKIDLVSGTLLSFEVTSDKAVIHIERLEKEPNVIYLVTRLRLAFEKTLLNAEYWEKIGGEISIEMARLGIQFRFIGSPNIWDSIELIDGVILEDTLTPFYFRSRVMFVIRAMILVQEVFKKSLREIELFG